MDLKTLSTCTLWLTLLLLIQLAKQSCYKCIATASVAHPYGTCMIKILNNYVPHGILQSESYMIYHEDHIEGF